MTDGLEPPNYTQLPNAILDTMHDMGEAELRVTLAIARQTFGWHKQKDELSITQLMKLTGLSNTAVIEGVKKGMKRGVIKRTPLDSNNPRKGYSYFLLVKSDHKQPPSLVNVDHKACEPTSQALVNVDHIQKKDKESSKESVCVTQTVKQKAVPALPLSTHTQPALLPTTTVSGSGSRPAFGRKGQVAAPPKPQPLNYGNPHPYLTSTRPPLSDAADVLAERLRAICGVGAMASRKQQELVEDTANRLLQNGATVNDLSTFQEWWNTRSFGTKGDLPRINQVADEWGRAMAWKSQTKHGGSSDPTNFRYNSAEGQWEKWTGNSWGEYRGVVPVEVLQQR